MKWSIYNTIIDNGGDQYLLYNCANNKLMVCVKDIKDLLESNIEKIDVISQIHLDLYNYLKNNRFIVDDTINEAEQYIENIKIEDQSKEFLSLTINPTLNCNLKCWYCYEKHLPNTFISAEVESSIKKMIGKCISENLKYLHINFFGGEPLLEFDSFIYPLLQYINSLNLNNRFNFSVSFTTNALLLTLEKSMLLKELNVPISFQIPFDGGREQHNLVKKAGDGVSSYDVILNNIQCVLEQGFNVLVRCNYTSKNIESFEELVEDMLKIGKDYQNQIAFSFQQVWQTKEEKDTHDKLNNVFKKLECGTVKFSVSSISERCYADKENHIVINYNGDVYKCTARDFLSELREGVLLEDGTIEYNERYYDRMEEKYNIGNCMKCKIMPICNICTQKRLESFEENICFRGVTTDEQRLSIIKDYIKNLNASKIESY